MSKLEFGILERKQIIDVYCEKLTDNYVLRRVGELPKKIRGSEISEELEFLDPTNVFTGYFYTFDNPDGLAYRIHYQPIFDE